MHVGVCVCVGVCMGMCVRVREEEMNGEEKAAKRERRAFVKSSVPVNFQKTDRHFKLVCVCV